MSMNLNSRFFKYREIPANFAGLIRAAKRCPLRVLFALCCAFSSAAAMPALAQDFPVRPITIVIGQAAGGPSDVITRLWADFAAKRLGQAVIVDNKPGANGSLAAQTVLRQPADGHTLLSTGTAGMSTGKLLFKSLPYDAAKDFRGISMLVKVNYFLVSSQNSGIHSVEDLQRIAKANPSKMNFASAGTGNVTHLMLEQLQQELGIKLTHVPYKGEAAALNALLADEVQVMVPGVSAATPFITSGRMHALAVFGDKRVPELPQVPTAQQAGLMQGYAGLAKAVLVARAGTPDAIARKLHAVSQEFLADPAVQQRLGKMQLELIPGPVNAYETTLAADVKRWAEVTRTLNLIAE